MASIQRREGKKGASYRIRICNGVDKSGNPNMESKTWTPPAGMKKRDADKLARKVADQYENMVKKGIRPKTLQGYANMLKLINPHIGQIEIRELTKKHIRDYIEELQKPYYTKTGIEKHRSARTINDYYRTISAVLSYACEMDYLEDNICTQKGIRIPKQTNRKNRSIPPDVLKGYVKAIDSAPILDKVFFFLALNTGARAGEILGLKWSDIDFDNYAITISDNCQYITGKGIIYVTPKTESSERKLQLQNADDLFTMLRQLRVHQMENQLAAGEHWGSACTNSDSKGRLFLNEIGAPIHPDTPRKNIQKIGRKAGLPKITVHQLRHTFVSYAIANHEPITNISAFAGHANSRVTEQCYAHEIKQAEDAKKLQTNIGNFLRSAQ